MVRPRTNALTYSSHSTPGIGGELPFKGFKRRKSLFMTKKGYELHGDEGAVNITVKTYYMHFD